MTYDDNGNIIPLSERFNEKNEDIRCSERSLYKKQKSAYNEYNSLNMQWAYSKGTNIGDQKIVYNPRAKSYALIEATKTDVGFIELATGNQKELKGLLNHYDESRGKYDRWIENTRLGQRNNRWNSEYAEYPGKNEENGELSDRELGKSSDRAGDSTQVSRDSEKVDSKSNGDGRVFSGRNAPDIEAVSKALEKENAKLKSDLANVKELLALQGKLTHGNVFKKSSLETVSRKLMKRRGDQCPIQSLYWITEN